MNLRNTFLAILAFLIITGCNNDNELLTEDDYFISIDKAELVAKRVGGAFPNDSIITGSDIEIPLMDDVIQIDPPTIKSSFTLHNKAGKPTFYVINFEKGGYVILSADIRMGPILGVSGVGYFEVKNDYPGGLNIWMSNITENIEILRAGNYEVDERQKQEWEALLNVEQNEITTRKSPKYPLNKVIITEFKHIMHLQWNHHGDGYNDSVPFDCANNPGGRAYAGCVPVTIGQILRHWEHPKSYEWDKMPASHATPTTAKFLVDIGEDVNIIYSCNGSGSRMNIGYALRNFYGYNAVNDIYYTFEKLKNEFNYFRPVVLVGPMNLHDGNNGSHAWICEGYLEYLISFSSQYTMETNFEAGFESPRRMLYMNWGWHEYNGWYSNERFINGAGRFFIREMVTNIYPTEEE
jgi:Peptidase C10 family.